MRAAAAAHRAVGHAAPARGDRPLPRRLRRRPASRARSPSSTPASASRSRSRSSSRSRTWATWARSIEEPRQRPGRAAMAPVRKSIWPTIHPRILELVLAHRSTIIFCNARRLAERLAARLNELAETEGVDVGEARRAGQGPPRLAGARAARRHRGRAEAGRLRGPRRHVSSLELGIDMGAVDLVIQVESPGAVAAGLQRIGRAGHQVGEPSRGKLFPKHRGDLVEAAVVVQRMHDGLIEAHPLPAQPARRAGPADRGHVAPSTSGRSTTSPRWCAGRAASPT